MTLRGRLDTIAEPLGYAGLRAPCGIWLVAHRWPKWRVGAATSATTTLARRGFVPALLFHIAIHGGGAWPLDALRGWSRAAPRG